MSIVQQGIPQQVSHRKLKTNIQEDPNNNNRNLRQKMRIQEGVRTRFSNRQLGNRSVCRPMSSVKTRRQHLNKIQIKKIHKSKKACSNLKEDIEPSKLEDSRNKTLAKRQSIRIQQILQDQQLKPKIPDPTEDKKKNGSALTLTIANSNLNSYQRPIEDSFNFQESDLSFLTDAPPPRRGRPKHCQYTSNYSIIRFRKKKFLCFDEQELKIPKEYAKLIQSHNQDNDKDSDSEQIENAQSYMLKDLMKRIEQERELKHLAKTAKTRSKV